jgi:hypothetical protein
MSLNKADSCRVIKIGCAGTAVNFTDLQYVNSPHESLKQAITGICISLQRFGHLRTFFVCYQK